MICRRISGILAVGIGGLLAADREVAKILLPLMEWQAKKHSACKHPNVSDKIFFFFSLV